MAQILILRFDFDFDFDERPCISYIFPQNYSLGQRVSVHGKNWNVPKFEQNLHFPDILRMCKKLSQNMNHPDSLKLN